MVPPVFTKFVESHRTVKEVRNGIRTRKKKLAAKIQKRNEQLEAKIGKMEEKHKIKIDKLMAEHQEKNKEMEAVLKAAEVDRRDSLSIVKKLPEVIVNSFKEAEGVKIVYQMVDRCRLVMRTAPGCEDAVEIKELAKRHNISTPGVKRSRGKNHASLRIARVDSI